MHQLIRNVALCLGVLAATPALADEYTIAVGTPLTGSSIPRGRVGLGVPVSIDKTWQQLSEAEQQAWRRFTDLTDPAVTPPFPQPNIRGLLRKLEDLGRYPTGFFQIQRHDEAFLVVRVAETGEVKTVEIMRGADQNATELSDGEKVLAYVYINALTSTRFSPAQLDGKPVASAFPMQLALLRKRK